jgi:hypothetical protein
MLPWLPTAVVTTAVGNSPLILDESPFWRFRQYLEPQFVVQTFDEISKMEIRPKLGVSCRRLKYKASTERATHRCHFRARINEIKSGIPCSTLDATFGQKTGFRARMNDINR